MMTKTLATRPAAGWSAPAQPDAAAPAPSTTSPPGGSTYDAPGFTGATFSQQVPDLLSELRLVRHDISSWGAAGTRFPE